MKRKAFFKKYKKNLFKGKLKNKNIKDRFSAY
jgi:hypothetical protein